MRPTRSDLRCAPAHFAWAQWRMRSTPATAAEPKRASQRRFHGTFEAATRAIVHLARELSARAVDLVAASTPNGGDKTGLLQHFLKRAHLRGRRAAVAGIQK